MLQDELFLKRLITLSFETLDLIFKFLIVAFLHVVKLIKVSFFLILMLVVIAGGSIKCVPVTIASLKLAA